MGPSAKKDEPFGLWRPSAPAATVAHPGNARDATCGRRLGEPMSIESITEEDEAATTVEGSDLLTAVEEPAADETYVALDEVVPEIEEETIETAEMSTDSLQLFLKEVGKVDLLTAAQEVELAKRIERGDHRAK